MPTSTTQPEIIAPTYGYSLVPYTLLSGAIRIGVAAVVDPNPYDTGGGATVENVDRVVFVVTDSAASADTLTATKRTAQIPSRYDGGRDTNQIVLDWNVPIDLSTMADGWFTVVATVHTTDGSSDVQSKTLATWTAYNNTGGTVTPRTIYVRTGGNDAEDGTSPQNAKATIEGAVEASSGNTWDTIDLEAGETYSTIDFSANENAAGLGWVTFDCSEGTATLTGTMAANTGLGLHKRWAIGPGIACSQYRPSIQGGDTGGFWWFNGCTWSNPTEDGTPFTNTGASPARYEAWFATGLTYHTVEEFNTAPRMCRGVTGYNFRGDSFMKPSRVNDCTMYNTLLRDVIQSGGTHADVFQFADTATPGDVARQLYVQGLLCLDGEPAFSQFSNTNGQSAGAFCFEDCVLDNTGLGANAAAVNSTTNNNMTQPADNVLYLHCTFIDQSQRWRPISWDHVRYIACVIDGNIISNLSAGGADGDQTDLDATDTTVDWTLWTGGIAGFTSIPGANRTTGTPVYRNRNASLAYDVQDLRLASSSPGVGTITAELYAGRPAGERDPGAWARTGVGDFTAAIRQTTAIVAESRNAMSGPCRICGRLMGI